MHCGQACAAFAHTRGTHGILTGYSAAQCRLQGTAEECSRHCDAQPRCAAFTHKRGAIKATCVLYGAALHARLPPVRGYGPQGEQRLGVWLGWEHDAVEVKARPRPPARPPAHRRVSAGGTREYPVSTP